MHYRLNFQPDPMKDYKLMDIYGNEYIGRWLVGRTYEGWYIKTLFNKENNLAKVPHAIYSQKEIKMYGYKLVDSEHEYKNYIPRRLLDEAFSGHTHISDFGETPEILSYLR